MHVHDNSRHPGTHPNSGDTDDERSRSTLTTELLTRARNGGKDTAADIVSTVVLMHLDVAESVAWRYHGRGHDHQDLVQVARLGLIDAVNRYDPEHGPFMSYAVPTMVGYVKRYFRDQGWVVRPPRHIQEKQAPIAHAKDELTQILRRPPTVNDVASHLGFTPLEVQQALDIAGCFQPASLDASTDTLNDLNESLGERDQHFDSIDALATVGPACRHLPDRERRLLYLRYFQMLSQEDIAAELNVSQVQVSRLLRKTLARLRRNIGDIDQ